MSRLKKASKLVLIVIAVATLTFFAVRIYDSRQMAPLERWHKHVPVELTVSEMDAGDWAAFLKAEDRIFQTMRAEVTESSRPKHRPPPIAITRAASSTRLNSRRTGTARMYWNRPANRAARSSCCTA